MQDEAAVGRGLGLWTALVLTGAGTVGMGGLHLATFWWDATGRYPFHDGLPLVLLLMAFAASLVLLTLLLSYAQPPAANPAYSRAWVRTWKSPATPAGAERLFGAVFLLMVYGFGWGIWAMNQQTHVPAVTMIDYLLRMFAAILLAIYLFFVLVVLQMGPRVPIWRAWGVFTAPPTATLPAQEAGERFPHAEPAEPPETPRAEVPRPETPRAR